MFPLHEDTILMLALLAAGGAMAAFISWYGRVVSWACAALFLIALAWPWLFALALGLDAYTAMMASYFSGLTLLAVTLGALWGLAARRLTAGALSLVQFYARPDGMPIPTRSHFNYDQVVSRLSAGEKAGYHRCTDSIPGPQTRYCTIWQPLTPEVLAVSTAKLGPVSDRETPVADAQVALRTLLSHLSPHEGQ